MIELRAGGMEAGFALLGAELQRLRWKGLELLWDGDPAWWGRRAPLLFPIVGRVKDGSLPQHGFARDLPWELLEQDGASCALRLRDDEGTRTRFPHAFELRQQASLTGDGLQFRWTLANPGPAPFHASLGAHPAFRWPLPGAAREAAFIEFEKDEPEPIRRLKDGLLARQAEPSPVEGRRLPLRDALFHADALVFDRLRSRRLRYGAPGAPTLELSWDFPHFGIWTRPGAPFICLEPWQGCADAEDHAGGLEAKPGAVRLAPGDTREWSFGIHVLEALP